MDVLENEHIVYTDGKSLTGIEDIERWREHLLCLVRLKEDAKQITRLSLSMKRWYKKKTHKQLGMYFGLAIRLLSELTGYTVDEAHWEIKRQVKWFHEPHYDVHGNFVETRYKSIAQMTTRDLSCAFEAVCEFIESTWMGTIVPRPPDKTVVHSSEGHPFNPINKGAF